MKLTEVNGLDFHWNTSWALSVVGSGGDIKLVPGALREIVYGVEQGWWVHGLSHLRTSVILPLVQNVGPAHARDFWDIPS